MASVRYGPVYTVDEDTTVEALEAKIFEDAVDRGMPSEVAARVASHLATDAIESRDAAYAEEAKRTPDIRLWAGRAIILVAFLVGLGFGFIAGRLL